MITRNVLAVIVVAAALTFCSQAQSTPSSTGKAAGSTAVALPAMQRAAQKPGSPPSMIAPAVSAIADQPNASTPAPDAPISAGDLLEVRVYEAPDYIATSRVDGAGKVMLPLIGKVDVSGLTVADAAARIAGLLGNGYFNNPQVSVIQKELGTGAISILGEVQKPGIYPMFGGRTLFDAISAAGGLTQRAGTSVTITHRARLSEPQIVKLAYDAKNSPASNLHLLPGDTVVVSKAGIVYVVGDVHQPSGFIMDNGKVTVLQAIAMAQGTNPTASLNAAKIIRRLPDGPHEVPIALEKILAAKAQDPPLQPDDILFIPNSKSKSALRRGLDTIVQTASGVAIYGRRY